MMTDKDEFEKYRWLFPPDDLNDVAGWDKYWVEQVSHGLGPLLFDMFCNDKRLIQVMFDEGMKSVLCAASGMSLEPQALAEIGFQVVALDFSPVALKIARSCKLEPKGLGLFCDPSLKREGGHLEYVVGDVLNPLICPGPFDVIIERRTSQLFPDEQKEAFMSALAVRLAPDGIFFCHCHDGNWSPPAPCRHLTRPWFEKNDWTIWNGDSGQKPKGQVAWLITTTG